MRMSTRGRGCGARLIDIMRLSECRRCAERSRRRAPRPDRAPVRSDAAAAAHGGRRGRRDQRSMRRGPARRDRPPPRCCPPVPKAATVSRTVTPIRVARCRRPGPIRGRSRQRSRVCIGWSRCARGRPHPVLAPRARAALSASAGVFPAVSSRTASTWSSRISASAGAGIIDIPQPEPVVAIGRFDHNRCAR